MCQALSKRVIRFFRLLMLAVGLILLSGIAEAGPIFFAGKMEGDKFIRNADARNDDAQASCYRIRYGTTTATIDGNRAKVTIQEAVEGDEDAQRTVCLVPLPESVDGKSVVISAGPNADELSVLTAAEFLDADRARAVYSALARGTDLVEILSLSGKPAVLIREFELAEKTEIRLEYEQEVKDSQGVLRFACPMPATAWARGPVSRASLSVTVLNDEPLRAIFSPTHNATVNRAGLHEATVRVSEDNWEGRDDFRLLWVADRNELGLRVVADRHDEDEDGTFMLFGNPTGSADSDKPLDKDVLFVLDTSGSMRGEKIEQARAAIEYCLDKLNPGDRFNLITFGTEVAGLRDNLVAKSADSLADARQFVESIVARGRTNIAGALEKALTGKAQVGRPRIMIFLTDGTPTAGELVPDRILADVEVGNLSKTRIFVMGLGHDVNAHLLDKLAEATQGSSEYIAGDEEIDAKVAALYDRLSHPVLTDVKLAFGNLRPHSVYPKTMPALFKGSQFMVFGRYREGGKQVFTISGELAGKQVEYVCEADLPDQPGGERNDFIAPLWAARKIGHLLQEIRLHGENNELIEEVVRLSKQFGIVTEYTQFIASSNTELSSELALDYARGQIQRANQQQAGKWAVNQARNDSDLQSRIVATKEANTFVNRQGKVVANENIRQFGDRVFYLRDGQWVDGKETGERKTRTVKLFSEEYQALLESDRDFAQAQQLGWAVSINVGDERIVVEKDGQQKNEALRRPVQPVPDQQMMQQNRMQQMPMNQRFNRQILLNNDQNLIQMPNQMPQIQPQQADQQLPADNVQIQDRVQRRRNQAEVQEETPQ